MGLSQSFKAALGSGPDEHSHPSLPSLLGSLRHRSQKPSSLTPNGVYQSRHTFWFLGQMCLHLHQSLASLILDPASQQLPVTTNKQARAPHLCYSLRCPVSYPAASGTAPGGLLRCIVVALHVLAARVQCFHSASQRPALTSQRAVAKGLVTWREDPDLRVRLKACSSWRVRRIDSQSWSPRKICSVTPEGRGRELFAGLELAALRGVVPWLG